MRTIILLKLAIFSTLTTCYNLLTSPSQLDPSSHYDYIIIGGGTAGSVLAARLSENAKNKVLVVEAGGRVEDTLNIHIPFLAPSLANSPVDWNYSTTPQPGFNDRSLHIARGLVLGGSSCINQMTYHRPSDGAWDHWADLVGDGSLAWRAVEKFWRKTSKLVPPVDGHDTTGEVIPAAHGYGPVNVSLFSYYQPIHRSIIETSKTSTDPKFRYNKDMNAGSNLGWAWQQASLGHGNRSCASTAYLSPLINSRPNLSILLNTQATKLFSIPNSSQKLELRTVELAQTSTSPRIRITARKEVILSAGFIGTPKLLLLSGIGPRADLFKLNITLLLDAPGVGAGLQDHILLPLYFTLRPGTETNDALSQNATLQQLALDQWLANRTGPYVNGQSNTVAYLRVQSSLYEGLGVQDPSNGAGSGHVEILGRAGFSRVSSIPSPIAGEYLTLSAALVAPLSSGSVTLASVDPFAYPDINPNYLAHKFDQKALVQAMKDILEFVGLSPLSDFVTGPYGPIANATSDEEFLAYARAYGISEDHGSCTVRMGGPVDTQFRLKGVKGVRVVDASVFPQIPNVHTQPPVYIFAEKAADLITRGL